MPVISKPRIGIAIGDPAGIGPEIAIKASSNRDVRDICEPVIVGDYEVLSRYAHTIRKSPPENVIDVGAINVNFLTPGESDAACGRAILEYAGKAVDLAMAGDFDAVVACPQTQSSIKSAGIDFNGYPSWVARRTKTDPDSVFMMLVSDRLRIAHVTLHLGIREALNLIDSPRIVRTLAAVKTALERIGLVEPKIAVSGINPHAGEGGLFGSEEIEIICPALEEAREAGIDACGPFGADTMYLDKGFDAYVVMYHDQGHIPAKLLGFDGTAALTIGAPVLFSSVAHGSALDIAGRGKASSGALVWAIKQVAGASTV
ncbi:MAG: 1,2-dihydroxy-3,5-cyclohexadiene-1,4-dicarboxylate dehydrogenase [Alphaproteobacteria bacterium MarineAlpha11_Bin1]|nr:MAG: 1,2-dihydroxy-3,5-cyclohexadiene-1,4-dicarboxylate dehydrogenase [Alphaproteobacteria bacterium MarineAlpha11_Bin1]|tara:strand:+ start:1812 stop:2759 length:948 start_codon:yes stop_codon:yes gene_type:complete